MTRGEFAMAAGAIGAALWRGDRATLARLANGATEGAVAAALRDGDAQRTRRGHYLGATFHCGGEWYWGVDRLHFLEERLRAEGLAITDDDAPIAPVREVTLAGARRSGAPAVLDFFCSLRSPYTYLAVPRVRRLAGHYGATLRLRFVLPMVMRGLPVPREKQLYIMLDTKREAEDAGVAFGRVSDPVGRPVERCFSLYPWARERGRAAELLRSFTGAAFAEGVDTGSDAGLRLVVERAGLGWEEARTHLGREGWREELEANRKQLFALGLWGVPSFRLLGRPGEPDYSTWGQDRLWRVEQEIRRRLARTR
jgi:2-hydroxychromene-2-carboxylate isomerase